MKKLLSLAAIAFVALGCSKTGTDDATPQGEENQSHEVTITASAAESGIESRVDFATNDDGDLSLTWIEGDALGAWESGATSFAKFSMVANSMSGDGESADFSGKITGESFRLIHPYVANAISNDSFTLDLGEQTTDMSGDGFNNMSSTTFMISEEITSEDQPSMKHMASAIRVAMRFTNLPADDLTITEITLGGGEGIDLPTAATADLTADVMADNFLSATTQGAIKATVENSPTVANFVADQTYTLMLSALPFAINNGEKIEMTVELTGADSHVYSKTFAITFDEDATFDRATYSTLAYMCDMTAAIGTEPVAPAIKALTTPGTLDLGEAIEWSATAGAKYTVYLKEDGGAYTEIASNLSATSYKIPNSKMSCTLVTGAKTYTVKVKAITSDETFESKEMTFKPKMTGTITDVRGDETNTYGWVRIGPRVWLSDNMKTAYFNDGTAIPYSNGGALIAGDANGSPTKSKLYYNTEVYGYDHAQDYLWTKGSEATNNPNAKENSNIKTGVFSMTKDEYIAKTGYVYSLWTAVNENFAPKGWHTATFNEWIDILSGSDQLAIDDKIMHSLGNATVISNASKIISKDYIAGSNELGLSLTPTATRAANSKECGGTTAPFRGDNGGLWQYNGCYWMVHTDNLTRFYNNKVSVETIMKDAADDRIAHRFTLQYEGDNSWSLLRSTWSMGMYFAVRCIYNDDQN